MSTNSSLSKIQSAIDAIRNGQMIILVDDEDRENEGDLVMAAEFVTPQAINFLATHARGLICLSLDESRIEALGLPMMTAQNQTRSQTAFTVSIEAKEGVTTGISAQDRAHTIRVAVDPTKGRNDLICPGHIFPLRAVSGGVLVRAGHTEGSVDLARLAGLKPAAVICEIMNPDGTMARLSDLRTFAEAFKLPLVSIRDLISFRMAKETLIEEIAVSRFPTRFSEADLELLAFRSKIDESEHIALVKRPFGPDAPLVRVHSECLTGDALGSLRCDCGEQLQLAITQVSQSPSGGAVVYMRRHEGRGIGIANKVRAYALQDGGLDTVEANRHLGFKADLRQYGLGAQILKHLGVTEMKLLTNNPRKVIGLDGYGLKIVEQLPIIAKVTPQNQAYLKTKQEKLGHELAIQPTPTKPT